MAKTARSHQHQPSIEPPVASTPQPEPESKIRFGATYVFRLRKQIEGPFINLWELSLLDSKACDKAPVKRIISDADALTFCMENLQGELEADGL